jgi:hypothetical protein
VAPSGRVATAALVVAANVVLLLAAAAGVLPLVLVVAVAAPVALAIVERPQRGLLALVALTPFHGLLVLVPLPPLAGYWKDALALAVLAATFLAPASARGRPGRALPRWTTGLVLLVGLGLASAVVVGGVQALVGLKITFFAVLVGVAAWRCPFDRRERDRLVTILMAVGAVTAAIGLLQQLVGPAYLASIGFTYNDTIRFAGSFMRSFSTFIQPFGFGFFLMVVLLVGVPAALEDTARLRNQAFLFLLPLYGLALLSTIVRGAWLGAAVGIAFLGALRYRALLLLIPLALVAVVFLPPEATAAAFSGSSSAERTAGWQENLPSVIDHPLGTGLGSTGSAALATARLSGEPIKTYQTDNYYIKVLLELGLLGLWIFVLLLGGLFSELRRTSMRLRGTDAALASSAAAMVLAAAAACTVATYFEIFPLDVLFWLLVFTVADLGATAVIDTDGGEISRLDHVKL